MKKALFTASIVSFINGFEANDMKILQEMGYEVEVAANTQIEIGEKTIKSLKEKNVVIHHIGFARSPLSLQTFRAYRELKYLLRDNKYDIIHCHTPVAAMLTRLAARRARRNGTTVIYTAHGFHFYNGAPLKNWIIYGTAEKICAYMTDVLITINTEDYEYAKKKLHAKKVCYIPGVGIDTSKFANVEIDRVQKRKELGFSEDNIILISVGELNKNKNHQVIIRALGKIQDKNIHYCIAGIGEWKDKLIEIAKEQGIEGNVHLLGYRTDIGELLKMADVFCFPSCREGLGLAALEAMAMGLPLITSNIHGINDYSINEISGYKCERMKVEQYVDSVKKLKNDNELRKIMGHRNKENCMEYDVNNISAIMKEIYGDV